MKGYSKALTMRFCNSWQNGVVTIGRISFFVTADFIVEATGFPNDGEQVERCSSGDYKGFMKKLFEKGEKQSLNSLSPTLGNEENSQKNYGKSSNLGLANPISQCSLVSTSSTENIGKHTLVIVDKESLELSLLNVNPNKRKLETLKKSPIKAKNTNKESASKSITIDLDLDYQEDGEEKPLEMEIIDCSSRERSLDRLRAKERKEEIKKDDNQANVKNLEEIYDLEEEDNSVDNTEDEDFHEEEDDPEENLKEKIEEEEDGDEIRETEAKSDIAEHSPEVPNLLGDEKMVPYSKTPLLRQTTTRI
ncbi:uncharacterized protein LOC131876514 [Cryptomeria japonica]|uniref:uncharacterized protein LOC131876514 n=1 Tax=Cryptomeria japonica TaxID=3369 RepID=UPI0027DA7081|nr:uncharacterized protein LOC131876514 [Cryptomeria japonica]